MKRIMAIILLSLSLLAFTGTAYAVERATANAIGIGVAMRLADHDGWHATAATADALGPQGGTIQWVVHVYVVRTGYGEELCHGVVQVGPYGAVVGNPTLDCQTDE
jgi:hypothetical protein